MYSFQSPLNGDAPALCSCCYALENFKDCSSNLWGICYHGDGFLNEQSMKLAHKTYILLACRLQGLCMNQYSHSLEYMISVLHEADGVCSKVLIVAADADLQRIKYLFLNQSLPFVYNKCKKSWVQPTHVTCREAPCRLLQAWKQYCFVCMAPHWR